MCDLVAVYGCSGHPALDVRLCDVCLVLGSDIRHPFIKGIGVATGVANMVASDLLMYYFVRSLQIINKMAACITQMERPRVYSKRTCLEDHDASC